MLFSYTHVGMNIIYVKVFFHNMMNQKVERLSHLLNLSVERDGEWFFHSWSNELSYELLWIECQYIVPKIMNLSEDLICSHGN